MLSATCNTLRHDELACSCTLSCLPPHPCLPHTATMATGRRTCTASTPTLEPLTSCKMCCACWRTRGAWHGSAGGPPLGRHDLAGASIASSRLCSAAARELHGVHVLWTGLSAGWDTSGMQYPVLSRNHAVPCRPPCHAMPRTVYPLLLAHCRMWNILDLVTNHVGGLATSQLASQLVCLASSSCA